MKINKKKLIDIIKEEIESLSEVEYDDAGNPLYVEPVEGVPAPDEAEVLVPGYGGLTIGQIRNRIVGSEGDLKKELEMIRGEERELKLADGDDEAKEMLIRSIESRKQYLLTQEEVIERFRQTLRSHNISS